MAQSTLSLSRNQMNAILQQSESIPPELQDDLNTYYRLFWSGKYILKAMQEGMIHKDSTFYHVCFHLSLNRGRILRSDGMQQYKLSFRQACSDYRLPAYVVISEI